MLREEISEKTGKLEECSPIFEKEDIKAMLDESIHCGKCCNLTLLIPKLLKNAPKLAIIRKPIQNSKKMDPELTLEDVVLYIPYENTVRVAQARGETPKALDLLMDGVRRNSNHIIDYLNYLLANDNNVFNYIDDLFAMLEQLSNTLETFMSDTNLILENYGEYLKLVYKPVFAIAATVALTNNVASLVPITIKYGRNRFTISIQITNTGGTDTAALTLHWQTAATGGQVTFAGKFGVLLTTDYVDRRFNVPTSLPFFVECVFDIVATVDIVNNLSFTTLGSGTAVIGGVIMSLTQDVSDDLIN